MREALAGVEAAVKVGVPETSDGVLRGAGAGEGDQKQEKGGRESSLVKLKLSEESGIGESGGEQLKPS